MSKNQTEEMELADLSRAIHVALRKATDSEASVVLWNLIAAASTEVCVGVARDLKWLTRGNCGIAEAFTRLHDMRQSASARASLEGDDRHMDTALRYMWKIADEETRQAVAEWVG